MKHEYHRCGDSVSLKSCPSLLVADDYIKELVLDGRRDALPLFWLDREKLGHCHKLLLNCSLLRTNWFTAIKSTEYLYYSGFFFRIDLLCFSVVVSMLQLTSAQISSTNCLEKNQTNDGLLSFWITQLQNDVKA